MYKIFNTADDVSRYCAQRLLDKMQARPDAVLGLATGSTMEPVYRHLARRVRHEGVAVSQLTTFNLDEYVGLGALHPQSYGYYMHENLFGRLGLKDNRVHLPDGLAAEQERACRAYTEAIQAAGGLDLQLLGIGTNGHIGFNEPHTAFTCRTHVVELSEQTRLDNGRFFIDPSEVPTHAITMGIQDILEAKEVLLVITGSHKAATVERLYHSGVDESLPASALKLHANAMVVMDSAAAERLPRCLGSSELGCRAGS